MVKSYQDNFNISVAKLTFSDLCFTTYHFGCRKTVSLIIFEKTIFMLVIGIAGGTGSG